MHPRATSREKKAETVLAEFQSGMAPYVKDGKVDKEGFLGFYLDLNCVLPWELDTYFVNAVTASWGLKADKNTVDDQHLAKLESILFEKIRQRTHGADDEGKTIKRFFKHWDLNGSGSVSPGEFK